MDNETKKKINKRYEQSLMHGEKFWPDSIFKDIIMALGIFILLVLLATFLGVHNEPKADPSDTSYHPTPEWYFLFLFKFLALYGQIPVIGKIEWIATVVIPGIFVLAFFAVPFLERGEFRHYSKRAVPIAIMGIFTLSAVTLTMLSGIPTGENPIGDIFQTVGQLVLPTLAYAVLLYLAFKPGKVTNRWIAVFSGVIGVLMLVFTIIPMNMHKPAEVETEEVATTLTEQILAGQDLYALHCVECHGDDGSVTEIQGVEGLEGKAVMAINSKDVLYTLNDASLAEVINYGRPESGMNPFGISYNPEGLSKSHIDYIVTFMRYSWDDRFEAPVIPPLYPPLAEGEIPNYDTHIQPISKRYCISCHREGKENDNYLMTSYEEILNTGDNKPLTLAEGETETKFMQVIQGHQILAADGSVLIDQMPPSKLLPADVIEVFRLWIEAGMPQSPAQ
ncbi:MAG TPA: c-type cytochrome [Anaerolineales bacterium]|nr:c-type cytochrome [Anaerolineales bacterium]